MALPADAPGETPKKGAAQLTPMLRHYLEVKAQHADAILLYRMGDFFELFFDDAVLAAPVLEVTLTARQRGTPSEAPMCGVPHHAVDTYVGKLLRAGYKVAICDQVEDPAQAKGLVKREVTRVMTPGTVSELELLEGKRANYLAAIDWGGRGGAVALLDVSTGELLVRRFTAPEEAVDDLRRSAPKELLFVEEGLPEALASWVEASGICATGIAAEDLLSRAGARELLERQLGVGSLKGFGLDPDEPAVRAAASAVEYARTAQQSEIDHVRDLQVVADEDVVQLDETTLRNLEVFANLRDGGSRGSLLAVLDQTVTAPGGRLLRSWLGRPLRRVEGIEERHDAVAELLAEAAWRAELRGILRQIGDLERLTARAVLGSLTPREAATIRDSLAQAGRLSSRLDDVLPPLLRRIAATDPVTDLEEELRRVLEEEPPAQLKEGGVIAEGVHAELDEVRGLARDAKKHVSKLQARERERTGIGSLKVRFNKVFGYYIEITKSKEHLVPEDYVRKQTLANAERFFTEELKELEEKILGAEERQRLLETEEFGRLRDAIAEQAARLRTLAEAVAMLDVLASFAELAAERRYCRPLMGPAGSAIRVTDGRHPVVEVSSSSPFVPNDTELDDEARIVLLTGPNMGGKSTYLRQVAHLVLLAQIGSYVPAKSAEIGVVDRLFTRVGASDDLARGESTFMVEMIETANILRYAGPHSLVVLDEVGRGTATFDGLSLAWAIVEYLHEETRPKTLFATHYHELTELAALLPGVVNRTMAVKEWQDQIVFLHRVTKGSADKSYGIHVARLAGLPEKVLERAGEILRNVEAQEYDLTGKPRLARGNVPPSVEADQLALFASPEAVVAGLLRELDVDRLTPLAALNLLQTLKERLRSGGEV